jgi:FkbM family methyltransferase
MIRETNGGLWTIAEDDYYRPVIEKHGLSIKSDPFLLPIALRYVIPGTIVMDCGALVGDHTGPYLDAVGPDGIVYAFEPGKEAFQCLEHNCPKAICIHKALSDKVAEGVLQKLELRPGSSYIFTGRSYDWVNQFKVIPEPVEFTTIDALGLANSEKRVSYLKIDVEGCEPQVLTGGEATIRKHRPVIILEHNRIALETQNNTSAILIEVLNNLGYSWQSLNSGPADQTDWICLPR